MAEKILMVDDDRNFLASCARNLRQKYRLETATGGMEGLQQITEHGPYALVISDRQMPGYDGIQFLARVRELAPETVRMMLTGNADLEGAIRVVNEGNIFRFLTKPCPLEVLGKAIDDGLEQYRLRRQLADTVLELRNALAQVKTLRGIIPICAHCKKIRNDKGFWDQVEAYVAAHSEAAFSHGICPQCAVKHYPEYCRNLDL